MKIILSLAAIFAFSAAVFAGGRVNAKKGKMFYKKYCRVCHDGSTDAVELTPVKKTIDQWNKAFAEGGKAQACRKAVQEKSGKELSDKDMLDIQAYVVQHAADSDQPATCGD